MMLVFGAYCYINNDIKPDEKFKCFTVDLRAIMDFFNEQGSDIKLDLTE